jgi:hypothetical protein
LPNVRHLHLIGFQLDTASRGFYPGPGKVNLAA